MNAKFSETLRKLREEKGLSQKQLGKQMFVNHSTIARWENGTRLPDAAMISRLAKCLGVDTNTLFRLAAESEESPNVIMVEDSKVILTEGLTVLGDVMPNATITAAMTVPLIIRHRLYLAAGSDRVREIKPDRAGCPGYRTGNGQRA